MLKLYNPEFALNVEVWPVSLALNEHTTKKPGLNITSFAYSTDAQNKVIRLFLLDAKMGIFIVDVTQS